MNIPHKNVSPDAMDALMRYAWKGNIRELENVLERSLILCEGDTIQKKQLGLAPPVSGDPMSDIPMEGTLEDAAKAALKIVESKRIAMALDDTGGNKTKAAEILKVSYKTLLTKIKDYKIES